MHGIRRVWLPDTVGLNSNTFIWPWNVYVTKATTSKGIVSLGYKGWANQISLISGHLFGVINCTQHAILCYMYIAWMTGIPQSGHLFKLNILTETQIFWVLWLFTLHGKGTRTGKGNWTSTSTIGNNGFWFISLSQTSVNISVQHITTHCSQSHSLYLSASHSHVVWISHYYHLVLLKITESHLDITRW